MKNQFFEANVLRKESSPIAARPCTIDCVACAPSISGMYRSRACPTERAALRSPVIVLHHFDRRWPTRCAQLESGEKHLLFPSPCAARAPSRSVEKHCQIFQNRLPARPSSRGVARAWEMSKVDSARGLQQLRDSVRDMIQDLRADSRPPRSNCTGRDGYMIRLRRKSFLMRLPQGLNQLEFQASAAEPQNCANFPALNFPEISRRAEGS